MLGRDDFGLATLEIIALVVVIMWAISFGVDMIPSVKYDQPPGIYAGLTAVIGALAAKTVKDRGESDG